MARILYSVRNHLNSCEVSLNSLHVAEKSHLFLQRAHPEIQLRLHKRSLHSMVVSKAHFSIKGRLLFLILFFWPSSFEIICLHFCPITFAFFPVHIYLCLL
jgi:hypothetical protein